MFDVNVIDVNQLLSILASPPVISFITTYTARKGLDGILNATIFRKRKKPLEDQIIICLDKALSETCNEFKWKYNSKAIKKTFLPHWRDIKNTDTPESFSSIIEKAVGHPVNSKVLEFWAHSFYKTVSDPQYLHLYNYLSLNKLKNVELPVSKTFSDTPHLLTLQAPPINDEFSHRDDMVDKLYRTITQNKKLALISGLGGIGKTSIAKALYHEVEGKFKHIAWVEYQNSIEYSLLNSFTLFDDVEDTTDRYKQIRKFLLDATKDTIIFIDNVSNDDSEGLRFIEQLKANVVLTSRSRKIGNFKAFTVGFLSEEQCIDIFYKYYEFDKTRKQEEVVRKLVQLVRCHTFSVELLARAANRPGYSLETYAAELKEKGFEYPDLPVDTNHNANSTTIAGHLKTLFELVSINDEQKRILINFAHMPSVEIPAEVEKWIDCRIKDIMGLTKLGWLSMSDTGYEMHPIVKEAILLQYKNVEYKDFESIIKYMWSDDYINATDVYTKVRTRLSIAESVMGYLVNIERVEIGRLFNEIGLVYFQQGEYAKALEWYQKALEICEKVLGLKHPDTATTYNNIAGVYSSQGDDEKALEWYQKALEIREKVLGLEHPHTASSYNNIANVYFSQGDYVKALELHQKALIIDEKISGLEHPDTATTYNNIALVYSRQGDYDKALEWYQKALKIDEKVLGLEHPDTVTTYYNIAGVYYYHGNYTKAHEWYQKTLEIYEKVLGLEHPYTVETMESIAIVTNVLNQQ